MSAIIIARSEVLEGSSGWNDGAIVIRSDSSDDGVLLTTADVDGASISLDVFELGNPVAIYTTSIAKADVISNTPVPWRINSIGRNFAHQIDPDDLSPATLRGGRRYDFIYRIPTLADGTIRCVWIWQIKALQV